MVATQINIKHLRWLSIFCQKKKYIYIHIALSDPGSMQFSHIIKMCGKLSMLVSIRGEKVMKWRKTVGQICPIVVVAFKTFSPGLENNKTSECGSKSFPRMMTYILYVENCQSYILTHSCLPIAGRLFYNVRKPHGARVLECNIYMLEYSPWWLSHQKN